jgi:hypothetical protein
MCQSQSRKGIQYLAVKRQRSDSNVPLVRVSETTLSLQATNQSVSRCYSIVVGSRCHPQRIGDSVAKERRMLRSSRTVSVSSLRHWPKHLRLQDFSLTVILQFRSISTNLHPAKGSGQACGHGWLIDQYLIVPSAFNTPGESIAHNRFGDPSGGMCPAIVPFSKYDAHSSKEG